MRNNFPVTQVEFPLADNDLLISRTNLKGEITYANPAFVRVSGFSLEELLGANHNLVRHPDMPPAAFADFWATLQRGEVWSGLVKNRRKDGDHYWVRANAVALKEQGQVVGYASLRIKPSAAEVRQAEAIYGAWREGKGNNYTLLRGQIRRRHLLAGFAGVQWRSATLQTRLLTLVAAATIGGLTFQHWRLSTELLPLVAGLFGLALVVGLGMNIWARIPRAIAGLRGFVLQVAAGNLTVEPPARGRDDMGQLVEALVTMKKGLSGIVQDVNQGAERVSPSVAGIRRSNASITRESENLATSVQQTAASTEQLTATVTQNADNAQRASQLALSNVKEVRDSGEGMARVVQRMAAITESARHMAETVSLIDTIAFQTNILALNASVEAARAGEHGKGFAVVASEVRTLANRSAEAAKEIHRLIQATNSEIEAGAKVVKDTEAAIARVVEASNRVNDIMGEISAASTEQSSGIAQMAGALSTMEHGVKHTANQMQTTHVSTQALAAETHQLINAIRAFRTVSDGHELRLEITAQPVAYRSEHGEENGHSGRHEVTSEIRLSSPSQG